MGALTHRGNFFDDFFRDMSPGFMIKPLHGDPLPGPAQIKIDVKESDAAYLVNAEVPGVAKEDIHVTLDGSVVTLRAEIKQEDSTGKEHKSLRTERYYGEVARSFQLPVDIETAEASAKYENGILTLTLPKKRASGSVQKLKIE